MKEFRPSDDFVSRVMKNIYACERIEAESPIFSERIIGSKLFRYAMSGGGVCFGIFLSPLVCV